MKRLYTSSLSASVARGAIAILLMSSATQLLAQNTEGSDDTKVGQDEPSNDIVVTGTLIRGIAPVGAPVLTIGREEIAKTGVGSTTELLRKIPQVSNIGADEAKTQAASGQRKRHRKARQQQHEQARKHEWHKLLCQERGFHQWSP